MAIDGEPRLLNVGLAGIFVAVIAAVLLVPSGANGAAWTFVISLYVMATLSLATLARELRTESPVGIWPAGYGRS